MSTMSNRVTDILSSARQTDGELDQADEGLLICENSSWLIKLEVSSIEFSNWNAFILH